MSKKILIIILASYSSLVLCCKKVIEKHDLRVIQDIAVWNDPVLLTSFVNSIYARVLTWDIELSSYTDESFGRNAVVQGTVSADNLPGNLSHWPYGSIRSMNLFLQNTENNTIINPNLKNRLSGEVYFLRAFEYFEMVKRYGGVPILTKPQLLTDDIFVTRNSTTECFNLIISDLDKAIKLLPTIQDPNKDLGRITNLAAYALKGRVLLFKASPQFNPDNKLSLWQEAYNANKVAIEKLNIAGYGLYDDYGNLFLDEMNSEVIFAIRFLNPGRTHERDAILRPFSVSNTSNSGNNSPTQELVDAYPLKDGSDADTSNPRYSQWNNRDARFDATIVYNGDSYFGRTQWTYINSGVDAYGAQSGSKTGYYCKKAINQSLTAAESSASGTDFIEIRYAEVLLNLAEATNEIAKTEEAYEALKLIRKRAKIEAGQSGLYGLKADMTKEEMRSRIQKERFVEFAFEQKRFWDLRRWKTYDIALNGKTRHGYVGRLVTENPNTFEYETLNLDDINGGKMIINPNIFYLPIKRSEVSSNPNLVQTQGWEGGTFDPVK